MSATQRILLPLCVAFATLFAQALSASAADESKKPLTFTEYKETVQSVNLAKHSVTVENLKTAITKKNTFVLDLREKGAYDRGHIKGALHLGSDVTAEKLTKLVPAKDATLILYCNNSLFPTRMISLTFSILPQVIALGYPNTFVLEPVYTKAPIGSESFTEGPLWDKAQVQPKQPEPKQPESKQGESKP